MFQSLFYWITYSYNGEKLWSQLKIRIVSILILLDYLFLYNLELEFAPEEFKEFQSLFYWITYSYKKIKIKEKIIMKSFNPYFTGLPILIKKWIHSKMEWVEFQSLFYWITYSYLVAGGQLINLTPHVSILILLDYLFL